MFAAWPNRKKSTVMVMDMDISAAADSAKVVCIGNLDYARAVSMYAASK